MKISLRQKHLSKKWTCQYLTRSFFIGLLLLVSQFAFAQEPSENGKFEVDYILGCAPLKVTLKDLGIETGTATILIHFNRDMSDRSNPNVSSGWNGAIDVGGMIDTTYAESGTYLIGQLNPNASTGDEFDFITIVVTESVPPSFTVATCTNNNILIEIDFDADTYEGYLIDFGDGITQTITKNDPPTITYAYASQNNYTISVTGQILNGFSATCGVSSEAITTILDLPLPQITALSIQSGTTALLTYSTLENNITYELEVDDGSGFAGLSALLPTDNPNDYLIDDATFNFEAETYIFRIVATEACGNNTGFSNDISSVSLTYSAAYNADQIDIVFDWLTSPIALTDISIIRDGGVVGNSPNEIGQQIITLNSCSDALTFQVEADFNGVTSRSLLQIPDLDGTLTPPTLSTPEIVFSGGDILIRWDAATVTVSNYVIYRLDSDGNYVQIGTSTGTQYADSDLNSSARQVCYRVSYIDECNNESDQSVEVCENLSSKILIPNAFAPDSTNPLNSTFKIADGVYRNFEFYVYNRWGVLLFSTTDSSQGWDGSFKGQQSPAGSYVYRIRYFDVNDIMTSVSDSFLLIR